MSFMNKAKNIQFARLEQWTHTLKFANNFPVPPLQLNTLINQILLLKNNMVKQM